MLKLIGKLILKLAGWKLDRSLAKSVPEKCVMIASPHTSNWDFVFMRAAFAVLDIPVQFTIKNNFMRFPLNLFFGPMGAIGIDRSPKVPGQKRRSMVEAMSTLFKTRDKLVIIVTPEGTRTLRTEWKTGFYYVAKTANVPVALGYLDFEKKIAGVGAIIHLSDDMETDMKKIMAFYKPIVGKNPERFSIDVRYDS